MGARRLLTIDDVLEDLARQSPGFGGFFFDTVTGALNVLVAPVGDVSQARAHVRALLQATAPMLASRADNAVIVPARYDFQQLRSYYRVLQQALPRSGIVLTDIDDMRNVLRVGVIDQGTRTATQSTLEKLGLPQDAVEVTVQPPSVVEVTLQQYSRPLLAGFQITAGGICTLGHSMKRFVNGVNDGSRYYLTNSHCTTVFGGVTGEPIGQPTLANTVGYEVTDPPLFTNADNYFCPSGRQCRYSDAALFELISSESWTPGAVAKTNLGNITISGSPLPIQAEGYLGYPGLSYRKVGRTTGTSVGPVVSQCADESQWIFVPGIGNVDTGRTMLCQAKANYASQPGDSGSPVFMELNGIRYGIGIHWGSNGTTSSLSNKNYIENEFAVQNGQITYSILP